MYTTNSPDRVSWFRPHLNISLSLIERAAGGRSVAIIDVGGGASTLVDDLLARGYQGITVLDISYAAIDLAKQRLKAQADRVHWIAADITKADLAPHTYDIWHDRAVFHFLTTPEERAAYVRSVRLAVKPGGHVIVATFGPEGPNRCSGLDVLRYDAASLQREFGDQFQLAESFQERHTTPSNTVQQFVYCHLRAVAFESASKV